MRKLFPFLMVFYPIVVSAQQDLNYFAGTWDFEIVFEGNTTGKPDITAKWFVEKGLDSAFCLLGHVELDGSTFTREMITYNPHTKHYIRSVATNTGSWLTFSSPGWKGDTLVWTGYQYDESGTLELNEVIVRESPTTFTARFYRNWMLIQTEKLKRIKTTHQE